MISPTDLLRACAVGFLMENTIVKINLFFEFTKPRILL